jgi:hypothetical protein
VAGGGGGAVLLLLLLFLDWVDVLLLPLFEKIPLKRPA